MGTNKDRQRKEIREVMSYRDGDYYVGSLATCRVVNILGGSYGVNMESMETLVDKASSSQIGEAHTYLRRYIQYMKKNPVRKCECCGSIVRK